MSLVERVIAPVGYYSGLSSFEEHPRRAEIINAKTGEVVFRRDVFMPKSFGQTAINTTARHYMMDNETHYHMSVKRLVDWYTKQGIAQGYFSARDDVDTFRDELSYLLYNRILTPNSPAWYNLGVEGHREQVAACFVASIDDDMDAIAEHTMRETDIFRWGSGSGSYLGGLPLSANAPERGLSGIRSKYEHVGDMAHASGPLRYMEGWDANAATIRSGGRTRRAACIRIMGDRHAELYDPEAHVDFIRCKEIEEKLAQELIALGYSPMFNEPGGAYDRVKFQNANNSILFTDEFMQAYKDDANWSTYYTNPKRSPHEGPHRTCKAREILHAAAKSTWACGCPGALFYNTINNWNTVINTDVIVAANPCQPGWATVLTPDGMRTFDEIDVGSTIWSGKQWTTVTSKVATGRKEVNTYETAAGTFYGTAKHRVVSGGEKIEAERASTIDTCVGIAEYGKLSPLDVMDGLVLGAGKVHEPSKRIMLLVGAEDKEYFDSEIGKLLLISQATIFSSIHTAASVVDTTVSYKELPRYNGKIPICAHLSAPTFGSTLRTRRIPNRFLQGHSSTVRGVLRGIFSANGSICDNEITLKSAGRGISEQVQLMLSSVGIPARVTLDAPEQYTDCVICGANEETYTLRITMGRRTFADTIGFLQKYKTQKLQDTLGAAGCGKTTYDIKRVESLGVQEVFDITVDAPEHTYWTGGLLVSNCGEFLQPPDTACNLMAIKLTAAKDPRVFGSAIRIAILAQDISVSASMYPHEDIRAQTENLRPLGLGLTDVGAFLMSEGVGYGTEEGRQLVSKYVHILTATAYSQSARIAARLGTFPDYEINKECVQNVLEMHAELSHKETKLLWAGARDEAARWGLRNSQVSLMQPTGTGALHLDCDTTGIEPAISLLTHKELIGGGSERMLCGALVKGLRKCGYDTDAITEIEGRVRANKGIKNYIREEHREVFYTAFGDAAGDLVLSVDDHLNMMSVIQNGISGGISKTVNMPESATVEDVENVFVKAYKLGLKSVAIYRNGSKGSQPVTIKKETESLVHALEELTPYPEDINEGTFDEGWAAGLARGQSRARYKIPTAQKVSLPSELKTIRKRIKIYSYDGIEYKLYIHVAEHNGQPVELFLTMGKQGHMVTGLLDAIAVAVSVALQHGTPIDTFISKFAHTSFSPTGRTDDPNIRTASSPLDAVFRWLATKYGGVGVSTLDTKKVEPISPIPAPTQDDIVNLCSFCGVPMSFGRCFCLRCGTTIACSS